MYPPFPGGLRRKARGEGGFVSNYFVPGEIDELPLRPRISADEFIKTIVSVYQLAAYSSSSNLHILIVSCQNVGSPPTVMTIQNTQYLTKRTFSSHSALDLRIAWVRILPMQR